MSDCAEQYYKAWCGVFGQHKTKKLICIWHVDRAWRKALNEHVPDKQDRSLPSALCLTTRNSGR